MNNPLKFFHISFVATIKTVLILFFKDKRQISLLLISALLVSPPVLADKKTKTGEKNISEDTKPFSKLLETSWTPNVFDSTAEQLPLNYLGVDPIKFFETFKTKTSNIKKDEFETTEEFKQRTLDTNKLIAPINTNDLYAFRINDILIKYDADNQIYNIEQGPYPCKETYNSSSSKGLVTCKVSNILRQKDTYLGSNAYGTTITIERTQGIDFSLAISKENNLLTSLFQQDKYFKEKYRLKDRVFVPLDKARELKDKNIAVLFIGRVTDAKFINGRSIILEPKIDSPTDIFITDEGIPFNLIRIVYYAVQTGEIIGERHNPNATYKSN